MKTPAADDPFALKVGSGDGFHTDINGYMAVLLLGAVGLFIWYFKPEWNFDFNSPSFNPAIFVPFFIGGYGLYHAVLNIRGNLRARAFGESSMQLQGLTVRMGEKMKGVVRASVELRPLSDYEIRLQCIESFVMHRMSTSDSSRNVDRIRWEHTIRVAPASANSKEGIPFEFTLPAPFEKPKAPDANPAAAKSGIQFNALASINIPGLQTTIAHNRAPNATRWVLEITAPLKGINYYAIFGVIVEGSTSDRGTPVEILLQS
jgi:hypothetical protein